MKDSNNFKSGYSEVNGLKMYYETYGEGGCPLVLIHGGGSTIQTSFGRIIPYLAKERQIVAVELQAHGRTGDRDTALAFTQDADDVARLLHNLEIPKAYFFGFSNGANTTIEIALRHPGIVNKIILASTFYKRSGAVPYFWEGFGKAILSDMPESLRQGFLAVNNSPAALQNMFDRDVQRMKEFKDWSDDQISSITVPALVLSGTKDVGTLEHAIEMYRTLPNGELAILPGYHGQYLGAIESLTDGKWTQNYTVAVIEEFLYRP